MRTLPLTSRAILIGVTCLATRTPAAYSQSAFSDFSLTWTEVVSATHAPVSNPNGIVEPGESARISVSVEFNPVGTVFPGGSGPLTVAGFAYTGFSLFTDQVGGWADIGVPAGFVGSPLFNPNPHYLLQQVWQPDPPLGGAPIPTNPISSLWSVVWSPQSFQPQAASFTLGLVFDQFPELFFRTGVDPQGNPLFVALNVDEWDFGSAITVPIVPAPSILSTAVLASVFGARRRR